MEPRMLFRPTRGKVTPQPNGFAGRSAAIFENLPAEIQAELPPKQVWMLVPKEPAELTRTRESGLSMRVFLSWSGEASQTFASILHEWLPTVLQFADPWMSSEDITKGTRWDAEMGQSLEETSYCIVCVTPGVQRKPWVNFEAGAVSKIVSKSYVSPLLLGVSIEELGGLPLSMFQCTRFNKAEVLKLLRSINSAAISSIPSKRLKSSLDYSWAELRERVEGIDLSGIEDPGDGDQEYEAESDLLDDRAEQILILVATSGGYEPTPADIAAHLDQQILVAQYHIDRLVKGGFLNEMIFVGPDPTYSITRTGRAYVVENGLV